MLWSRDDFCLAGVGEALRIPVSRPDGAAEAVACLAELRGADEVDRPGTGPVGFGAFPFDRSATGELIVPEIVIGRGSEGRRWVSLIGDGPADLDVAVTRLREMGDRPVPRGSQPSDFLKALRPAYGCHRAAFA